MVLVSTDSHDTLSTESVSSSSSCSAQHSIHLKVKKSLGKGSHGVATIKRVIKDEENWETITKKGDYQFPGVFSSAIVQKAFYTPNCTQLPQSTANPHYLWDDIRYISKSGCNKDRDVDVLISDKSETLMYRIDSCNGVKSCPSKSCNYVGSISAKKPCSIHSNLKPVKSSDKQPCPVQFA